MPGPAAANRGRAGVEAGAGAAEREGQNRDGPMHLRARDNRQTTADYGDIDKPEGEITDYERHPVLDEAVDKAVELLRVFRRTPVVLGEIKTYIESYIETRSFNAIPDPEVDIEQAPQAAPNEPQDDAPISQTHLYRVRTFVNAIEEYYEDHLHNANNERRIKDILRKFCKKIDIIPGCLLARVIFADISKLTEMLKDLQQVSMEIKNKVFTEDIMKDKFITFIKQEKYLDDAEELIELFSHVAEQLRVMMSVPHVDLLSFMGNSKSVVTFTIQARLVPKDKVVIDQEKTEDFLHKFDDHDELKTALREILVKKPLMSEVELEKLSLSQDKGDEFALSSLVVGAIGAIAIGAVGGAKPGLLIPPPASSETEIPTTSEKEIEIRLPIDSTYGYVYNLCKEFGVISEIAKNRRLPGTFTVAFEQKSSAEKALSSPIKDKYEVSMARLSQQRWRSPLSETALYMGERTLELDDNKLFNMAAEFSGFDKESSRVPKGEGYAILKYNTGQDTTYALEGFQNKYLSGAYVTRARAPSRSDLTKRTLSYAVEDPPHSQLPKLYFSKLPGAEMSKDQCETYLRNLVGDIVSPEKITDVNVPVRYKRDDRSGHTFRPGFCTLKSIEDCKAVISALRSSRPNSIARGFEKSVLLVNWAGH